MVLEVVKFKGEPVGIQLTAETDAERNLLWALRNVPAKVDETFGLENPRSLRLCPSLPWRNVE